MHKIKIKTKLILILSVVLVLAFVSTNVASYLVSRSWFRSQSLDEILPLISNNIYSEIQADIMRPIHVSSLMAHDTFLKDWALAGEKDLPKIYKYLLEIKERYKFFTTFYVSERTKKYYYYGGLLKTLKPDNAHDQWYYNFIASGGGYDLDVDSDEAHHGTLTVFINHRVTDHEGRLLGVTGVGLNIDRVGAVLASYQKKYHRTVYMVDAMGLVQVHSDKALIHKANLANLVGDAEIARRMLAHRKGTATYQFERQGQKVLLATRYFPDFSWLVVVEQNAGAGMGGIRSALISNLVIGLLVTAFIIGVVAVVVNRFQGQLEEMATVDDLTQVSNRRFFMQALKKEVARADRYGHPTSLLMIDTDHFKSVNDRFGHDVGDRVLRELAGVLKSRLRDVDVVGRLGGEEFAVLMPSTEVGSAVTAARRIKQAVSGMVVTAAGHDIQTTVSIGVACSHCQGTSDKGLLKRADLAMYRAKDLGRDRVSVDGVD